MQTSRTADTNKDRARRAVDNEREVAGADRTQAEPAGHPLLHLQQQMGNRQVTRLVKSRPDAKRFAGSAGNRAMAREHADRAPTAGSPGLIQRQAAPDELGYMKHFKTLYDLGVVGAEALGKGGKMPGIYGDVAGGMLDILSAAQKGESVTDAVLGAGGNLVGGKFVGGLYNQGQGGAGGGVADAVINAVNAGAQIFGAPQGVTDVTQTAADVTPSQMMQQVTSTGFKSWANIGKGLFTGDWGDVDKSVEGMQKGEAGGPLQGYALMADIIPDLLSGRSFDETIMAAGSKGQDTPVARIGNFLGDEAFQFINKDLPEAKEFLIKDIKSLLW
jgi:hypothetical protein